MIIANLSIQGIIANKAVLADTPFTRMKGLLGRALLENGEALVITRCNSIHMFFMRFPIDVVFIDRGSLVVGLVRGIRPYRFSPVFWSADAAIELPAGTIDRTGIMLGQHLHLEGNPSPD